MEKQEKEELAMEISVSNNLVIESQQHFLFMPTPSPPDANSCSLIHEF